MLNTKKAEASNQITWETDFADVYSVAATIEVENEKRLILADIICVPKMETRTINFKDGGPSILKPVNSVNPPQLSIPISENFRVEFSSLFDCRYLSRKAEANELPLSMRAFRYTAQVQHISDPLVACTIDMDKGVAEYESLRLFPIEILSATKVRIRDVISRREYGPADRAEINEIERNKPSTNEVDIPTDRHFIWSRKNYCWADMRGNCSSLGLQYCPPSL